MELHAFCSSTRVLIVAGKGGVGKTTVTAAVAVAAARAGLTVLVIEVEGKSGLATAFGQPPLTYEEAELYPGVRARTLTPDEALLEYLADHGLRRISKRLVSSGALDVISTAVPGMKDILVLGKAKSLDNARVADLILIDAPAAGHAITFLLSPRGLLDAVRVGPIRTQAIEVCEMLSDPARCQVLLVTIPEETPVNEIVETAFALEDRVGLALGPVVVNGIYADLGVDGGATVEKILADATALDVFVPDREAGDLAAAAAFRAERHSLQVTQVRRLAERLPLPQIHLPFLFTADLGLDEVERLAGAFARGVEAIPERAARR
jgi:anion-transporting  ArsA/GET3 family ATPase